MKPLRYFLPVALMLLAAQAALSQHRYFDRWYFGALAGLDFNSGVPVAIEDGAMLTQEGCASISDPVTGRLLFYTDGVTIWDAGHEPMANGTDLLGSFTSAQSALIVPRPDHPDLFYVFTAPIGPYIGTINHGIRYSIVDMTLNGGRGAVTDKNLLLLDSCMEMLNATLHCNGKDYWVMGHELGSSHFVAWLITADGITDTVVSAIGDIVQPDTTSASSPQILKFSPDGRMVATTDMKRRRLELYDFDVSTGALSNFRLLGNDQPYYGVEFSPDNSKVYSFSSMDAIQTPSILQQFDLNAGSIVAVRASRVVLSLFVLQQGGALQLGPDLRIYASVNGHQYLSVIAEPNQPGPACDFRVNEIYLGRGFATASLPNCITAHYPGLTTIIDSVIEICPGEGATIRTQGKGPFRWSPSEGLSCTDCPDPVASPNATTAYVLTDLRDPRCPIYDTVTVVVRDGPTADAGRDATLCSGDSVRLHGSGGMRYRWSPSAGLSCTDCPDPVAAPEATTVYVVQAFDSAGCWDRDSIVVTVAPPPKADAGRDTAVCSGESVQLWARGGVAYKWRPVTGLSCESCENPLATPAVTTTYEVTVTDMFGCTAIDSVTVTVSDDAVKIEVPDTAICAGDSVRLSASGKTEYTWSPNAGLNCTDCPDPVATPATTTTYVVRGATNGRCVSFDTITITVRSFDASAGADTTICLGDSVRLSASGGVAYEWTSGGEVICDDCPDPVIAPKTTTTYRVLITGANGCTKRDSLTVTVRSGGDVRAAGDTAFCRGGTARLSAAGAETYRWSPAAGLSCTDCPDPFATPGVTTTYYVIGTNASGGCPSLDSVTLTVFDLPEADAGSDTAICAGATVQLRASGGMRYVWEPSPALSCLDCADPIAAPASTAIFYVTVVSAEGCEALDSVIVTLHPSVIVAAGADRSICSGDTTRLSASGGVRWRWEPADGLSCTDCPDPFASPGTTTVYRVTAWNAEGCEESDDVRVAVRDEKQIVRLRIGRNHRGGSDRPLIVPVEIVDTIDASDVTDLELVLEFDPTVMRVDETSIGRQLIGTALEGWNVEIFESVAGRLILRLTAPPGRTLNGGGTLLRLEGRVYVSNVLGTDLPFRVSSQSRCVTFETEPGYARLDSVCGLNFRLIELTLEKYVAPTTYPNPARERVTFDFGLGLEGSTRLEVFDALGKRVGLILHAELPAGRYEVDWDVRDVPSGVYWYRLTSGDWSRGGQVHIAP